jgi:transposase
MIAQGGLCAKSQVYRIADRFIEHGPMGLADRREDNGENKVTDAYGAELLRLIDGSPQEYGYRRPTWTQELLVLVLAEQTGIRASVTTMCRLLRELGVRLNRPKPTVNCPWPRSRRTRRLRAIQRLIDNLASG